jgi:probable blue pigment (indigoidine) exporter
MEANSRWIVVTAVAPVAWGTNYYVTRHFLPVDFPLWGAAIRALPAGLILLALTRTLPHGSWWWKSVVLGVLNIGAFFVLIYVAAQLLPSSVASILMALSAVVMALLAWPLLSERPGAITILGALVGFLGVSVMLLAGSESIDAYGVLASIAAMTMSSIGYVLAKKWSADVSLLALCSWQLIAGGLVVTPVAVLVEGSLPSLDAGAVLGFAYVTIVATAVAFVAWFAGLRHLPAATVGLVGLLNPVTGVLLGTVVASEPFGLRQVGGTALVLVGVLIGRHHRSAREASAGRLGEVSRTLIATRSTG